MAQKIVIVEAHKDTKGNYVRPNRYTEQETDIKFPDQGGYVQITGYKSGETIPDGKYYIGFFDDASKKFVGTFQPVAGFTVQ